MTKEKEEALNYALDRVYNIGFGLEPDALLEHYFDEKLLVIGTTVDEKFFTLDGMRTLIRRQQEQSIGMELHARREEIFRDFPASGNVAIVVEDVFMTFKVKGELIEFDVRSSTILEYKNDLWKLIHWHASKPEIIKSEVDTYGVDEWKRKNEQLEKIIAERTADLLLKNTELELAMAKLSATQTQLIQSEKMASLGELTAGIAHEIQNPLNFVNNFAEVSEELLQELEDEVIAGNKEEAIAISSDLKNNLQKINHHGKRADSIVKGMLQHSRSTSGQKELTDINALADEYLRLAYHGLRAKDKSFNATMKTEFAVDLSIIDVVPQDIGRVLLNLFTNAFYSVSEKKRKYNPEGYEPTVCVSTKNENHGLEIIVEDNGMGIPPSVIDKIMQPFFTTKPTGEGTGLGLSMSYDIIMAHNGRIVVESNEQQFARFTIVFPYRVKE